MLCFSFPTTAIFRYRLGHEVTPPFLNSHQKYARLVPNAFHIMHWVSKLRMKTLCLRWWGCVDEDDIMKMRWWRWDDDNDEDNEVEGLLQAHPRGILWKISIYSFWWVGHFFRVWLISFWRCPECPPNGQSLFSSTSWVTAVHTFWLREDKSVIA